MKKWINEEAMNSRNLQNGGPFTKVILRRLDSEIINVFSTIIAAIDINYNLELLVNGHPELIYFWLKAFNHQIVSDTWEQDVLLTSSGFTCSRYSFFCCFPFSFIFQEAIERQWKAEKFLDGKPKLCGTKTKLNYTWLHESCNYVILFDNAGRNPQNVFSSLCSVMQKNLSSVESLLNSIPEACHVEMGRLYIMDLVSTTFPSSFQNHTLVNKDRKVCICLIF